MSPSSGDTPKIPRYRNMAYTLSVKLQRLKYVLADWVSTSLAFFLFNVFRYYFVAAEKQHYLTLESFLTQGKVAIEQLAIPVGCLAIFWLSGYYNKPYFKSRLQEFITTFFAILACTVVIFLALLTNDMVTLQRDNYTLLAMLFGCLFVLVYLFRSLITATTLRAMRHSGYEIPIVVYGASKRAVATARQMMGSATSISHKVMGYVAIPGESVEVDRGSLLSFDEVTRMAREKSVSQIVLAPEDKDEEKMLHLLDRLFPLELPVKIAPDTLSYVTAGIRLQDIYAEPFVDLTSSQMTEASKNLKRTIDVVLSAFALLLCALPFCAIAIAVKRDSPGPVFYRQQRIGLRRRPFYIYKFRSMRTDAEASGPRLSSGNDDRITRVGAFMRKYRIDELPQFWNVLRGDMSLVGPRPEREFFIAQILRKAPWYVLVHQVRPGITSWGMVKYGYAMTVDEMVKRARFDLVYLSNMSNSVDIKILIYTIRTVVKGQGM